jgi:hypothetical protein
MISRAIATYVLVCAQTAAAIVDWKSIKGSAIGNFEYIGALCFPTSSDSSNVLGIEITMMPNAGPAPSNLELLFYDDQLDSFPMITRSEGPQYTGNSCVDKSMVSKSFNHCTSGATCSHGLKVSEMSYSVNGKDSEICSNCSVYNRRVSVKETVGRIWYFVLAQCSATSIVQVHEYRLYSAQAIPCANIRNNDLMGENPADLAGYDVVIVILLIGFATTYVFLVRMYYAAQVDSLDLDTALQNADEQENGIMEAEDGNYDRLL